MKQISSETLSSFPAGRLVAYAVSRELLVELARVTRSWSGWAELADQARRASLSAMLNIAEGASQVSHGAKRRHYAIALASVGEVAAAVDAADALGLAVGDADATVARLGALAGGLVRATR